MCVIIKLIPFSSRYLIRHSPSEPHLVRQSSSPGPGPPSIGGGYYSQDPPTQPQLARPDITNLTSRSLASSKPDLTHPHPRPLDKPTLARPPHRGGSQPDVTQHSPPPIGPPITFLGSPKTQLCDNSYNSDKLKEHHDFISSYSSSSVPLDRSVNFDDFLPVRFNSIFCLISVYIKFNNILYLFELYLMIIT